MKMGLSFKLVTAWLALSFGSCFTSQAPPPSISTEGNIAKLTARILEQSQYRQHPLDDEMAAKFLDRYLEELDGQHLDFLQSDLEEFAAYRNSLDELTKAGNI